TANGTKSNETVTLDAAASYGSLSDVVSELNKDATGLGGAAFGDVKDGSVNDLVASVYDDNKIRITTRDEGSAYSIQMNAVGTSTGDLETYLNFSEDVLANNGIDARVSFDEYVNTIDTVNYASTGTTTLATAELGDANRGTISMVVAKGSGAGVELGGSLLDVTVAQYDVRLDGGPAHNMSAGSNNTIYNADHTESAIVTYGLSSAGGTETISNVDRSLVFQIGGNVGQTTEVSLRSMAASSLGNNISGNLYTSLAGIDVTTVQGAQDSQSIIDQAINEVSTTRGTLGSFQKNTLDSNLRNLRIASQNLIASESQIRDTDMAAEMSEFTKHQILLQAGTSMLAQANQVPQTILSLFR
ncbi:MAG: flagellin, partial [candidate division Zixibacteria bacterium]|nr:flagellin [candidate division Zixibacteria bacterium]